METAINELTIKLDILRNNEPICRNEGRTEEADRKRGEIAEITEAIEVLRRSQISSLPALEADALEKILREAAHDHAASQQYLTLLEAIEKRRNLGL